MKTGRDYKFWFCTGSQDLYGDECLRKVAEHSKIIVEELNKSGVLPFEVVWKPTLITNELIRKTFNDANADENCAGVIAWMHTFSPAKSWILGLKEYRKPLCHLHTQFNVGAHGLSALYDTPHGVACAILLPVGLEYNKTVAGERYRAVGKAMGVKGIDEMNDAQAADATIAAVKQLSADVGIPANLQGILKEEDIHFLAESAFADACRPGNPRDTSVEEIEALYKSQL